MPISAEIRISLLSPSEEHVETQSNRSSDHPDAYYRDTKNGSKICLPDPYLEPSFCAVVSMVLLYQSRRPNENVAFSYETKRKCCLFLMQYQ